MSAPAIAFFNNKGGVGTTSLVYHLSWMYAELGLRVVAADLDPQANLTAAFLQEDRLEDLWPEAGRPRTIHGCVQPLAEGTGDISEPFLETVDDQLSVLAGDLGLSTFEDELFRQWSDCMDGKERAFRVISAFWRILRAAIDAHDAQVALMDLGPNLGAINRAALVAADHVVVPLSPDLFSLQGLRNLGPRLREWRREWQERLPKNPSPELKLPDGDMTPEGYVVLQHSVRLDRPVKAYERWTAGIPDVYRTSVLDRKPAENPISIGGDPLCLAVLKHYRSLVPLAREARKPMFLLKPADGAIGSHARAVNSVYSDFKTLAGKIADKTGVSLPYRHGVKDGCVL